MCEDWKLRKKGFESSWEGPYQFVGHILDGVHSQQTNDEGRVYITKILMDMCGTTQEEISQF
jgi:hypothetical protein